MRIAFLAPYSKQHCYRQYGVSDLSVEGKDVWFFRYIPDRSIDVHIVGCAASLSYKKRIPLVMGQILGFLPSVTSYDVVISSGFLNGVMFSALRKVAPLLRRPRHVILDTQAATFLQGANRLSVRLARFFLSPVDGVICLSGSEQLFWEQRFGLSDRVVFAPFAIDSQNHHMCATTGDYIFSCGATRRDWAVLISAMKRIDARLVIVAGRDSSTGKHSMEGREIPGNTEVLLDIPYAQYRDLLGKSMFVVVPLKSVPFTAGLTVITQAMAMGKAVIATRNPALLDYITDGQTGLFVPPGDAVALARKITFLLDNPPEVERIGLNARKAMNTHLGERAMGEAVWSLLQRVRVDRTSVSA